MKVKKKCTENKKIKNKKYTIVNIVIPYYFSIAAIPYSLCVFPIDSANFYKKNKLK